jgi:pimeloyl-ACP methyl ester carboxylesterase
MARQVDLAGDTQSLTVPGARLYYEVSGSGPVLLLIPGGAADATIFAPIAGPLAERYTVVRYDPRGISRSPLEDPAVDVPVERHADDAGALLAAVGTESAFVLGSSGGGTIGLALAARHPDRVQTLVAHEPPVVTLLPEGSPRRGGSREIYDTYKKEGPEAAMQQFLVFTGFGQTRPLGTPSAQMQEAAVRMRQNLEFFLAHYLLPITDYVPDVAALQSGAVRVVIGVGAESAGQLAHDTALALAERLGVPPVTFPGGHAGYVEHPTAFAARLRDVLQAS